MPCLYLKEGICKLDDENCKDNCKDAVPTLLEQIISWRINIERELKEIEDGQIRSG